MAIDTAAKRRGVAGIPFWLFGPGVTPDVAKDAFWRQSAGWGYGGILASAIVVVVVEAVANIFIHRVRRRRTARW